MNMEEDRKIDELLERIKSLEQFLDSQRIIQDVDKEVYTIIASEGIKDLEQYLANGGEDETTWLDGWDEDNLQTVTERKSDKIKKAKSLLEEGRPEEAANLFMQLGSCHRFWALKKQILKEKYGITWYSPAELNPDIKYD
jgi:hypothetical protein